jgi:hypothetical protein
MDDQDAMTSVERELNQQEMNDYPEEGYHGAQSH